MGRVVAVLGRASAEDACNHRRRPMPDSDQRYVSALIDAHGEDYSAMAFDIGLNLRQFTETKLRGMCARFALLDEGQRCADL